MPHLCTACGRSFPDGSSEMLTGCPDCGGSTFQYEPDGTDGPVATERSGESTPPEVSEAGPTGDPAADESPSTEDSAQARARTEFADPPPVASGADTESPPATGPSSTEDPDRETVREALTEQFESIRVVERGQYELNLMELFDRDEYIVRLGEEGRYHIQMPESRR